MAVWFCKPTIPLQFDTKTSKAYKLYRVLCFRFACGGKNSNKMGMFDNLIINTDKLPVSDEEKKLIGKNPNWQTKDFDCDLTEIYITDEGELKINRWNYEEVPKEERPHPDGEGLLGLMGSMRRVNERLEVIQHHGFVNFYSNIGDDWYEFFAKFTDGKLVSIEGGKEAK